MIDKNICAHTNVMKSGKGIYSDGYYQKYRCKDCYTVIKGEKVNSPHKNMDQFISIDTMEKFDRLKKQLNINDDQLLSALLLQYETTMDTTI